MRTITQVQHTSCESISASTMQPPRHVPAPATRTRRENPEPKTYWGFKSLEVNQTAGAPIFIDFSYPPTESPSVAIGESLPPVVIKRGGTRRRGKYPAKKRIGGKKGKPFRAACLRLLKAQSQSGTLHLRPYIMGARWPVVEVPAPTIRDLMRPQRRELPNGLVITYRQIDRTFVSNPPADPEAATTPEAIRQWFKSVRTDGKYNYAS